MTTEQPNEQCPKCGIKLLPIDLAGMVERTKRYRENYPNTWDEFDTEVTCEDCAKQQLEEKQPYER